MLQTVSGFIIMVHSRLESSYVLIPHALKLEQHSKKLMALIGILLKYSEVMSPVHLEKFAADADHVAYVQSVVSAIFSIVVDYIER